MLSQLELKGNEVMHAIEDIKADLRSYQNKVSYFCLYSLLSECVY